MVDSPDETHLLLAPAPLPGRDAWEQAATAVLTRMGRARPGVLTAEMLGRRTVDEVQISPLGTGVRSVPDPGSEPYLRGTPARLNTTGWDVRTRVIDPDPSRAAAAAVEDLAAGGTSLWITVGGGGTTVEELPEVLDEVYLDLAPVVLETAGDVTGLEAASALAGLLVRTENRHPAHNLGADPIGRAVGGPTPPDLSELAEIASLARDLRVRAGVVDSTVAHQSGAAEIGELGYSLAVGVAYLREMVGSGIPVDDALGLLEFRYAATGDQFLTIAKLRAARQVWHRVAELSGASPAAGAQAQHAVTSWPMLTRYDPWTNLLRTTIAAFAAGVGGAAAITVLPFDAGLGLPQSLGRRLARNISALLTDESHVAAAIDPAGGASAVEMLTADLAAGGWAEFQLIEAAGGVVAALADGSIGRRWDRTATERRRRIATRSQPITGISEFPLQGEALLPRQAYPHPEPSGWAADFESMRDAPAPAGVFLATMGPIAAHTARAAFVANALAAGGVPSVAGGPNNSVTELLSRYDGSAVVCIAGADRAYLADGPALAAALRSAGARWIILAGRLTPEMAQLVDDSIAAGDDVVSFLRRTREQLSVPVGAR